MENKTEQLAECLHILLSDQMKFIVERSILGDDCSITIPATAISKYMGRALTPYRMLAKEERDFLLEKAIKIISEL